MYAPNLPIRLDQVCLKHKHKYILKNISLTFDTHAKIVAIIGPNGAGKTSLLRLLHALETPNDGHIKWGDLKTADQAKYYQAFVPQSPVLLRRSIVQNLLHYLKTLDLKVSQALIEKYLQEADLLKQRHQYARSLSSGERQRFALMRARIGNPPLILLDEPSANLDPLNCKLIDKMIQKMSSEQTRIIMVTHDLLQAKRLADRLILMHQGQIIATGKPSEIWPQVKQLLIID
ncbi:MAG: ABC transporter ATP-binding protein [Pseudomonadota bacterium]